MSLIITDIDVASEFLNNEDVIGIPTETVYGLAGNIYSEKAINKIYEIKKRPLINPLIVHIKSLAYLDKVAVDVSESALKLAKTFWPGPLTLVLNKHPSVPDIVTAGKSTVAVRIPNHPVALSLLESVNFPLAAPSANPFGCISPTSAKHVAGYFKDELQIILDGGICKKGIESTIIGFNNNEVILYRLGSISVEEIETVAGKVKIVTKNETEPEAPGMLSKHYAPVTTTILTNDVQELIKTFSDKKIGLLLFNREIRDKKIIHQEVLSKSGDLKEAAANLYAALHRLDKNNLDIIIAERFPDTGLGRTINDRLERATKR
ncbi:MAG: threonylcarbamoyl-AMP synthase [Hydrotalea flava]|uniref:L-threonylcarbamoyladenylate synthase n=1 Tax=Hydrotalea TaxID=1004300 RepID=UPI0010278F6D|nr:MULTISPECIES: L-threonylcarbamoyladenylate synthase [Hydrotalea]MBY0347634.1 threonylcarbamoyl-AMP synthase [Hydrotalea flava]NIM35123.1 threonylcarbamoyl-AMP synthase [Hydrotalea flava]NIM37949.1 threonylcarbamoyl-AMP synthase [Hydrotalea flava]NIN03118.1 threonylcarbamoyl-AMP synthase [Hydrotalea flava]NIN14803.1 threonylcarbamoyl-AMP synthase [Hydrotalea flava]